MGYSAQMFSELVFISGPLAALFAAFALLGVAITWLDHQMGRSPVAGEWEFTGPPWAIRVRRTSPYGWEYRPLKRKEVSAAQIWVEDETAW